MTYRLAKSFEERLVNALLAEACVEERYLIGSIARGEGGPTNDVDVAVYLDPKVSAAARAAILASPAATMMKVLGSSEVDLVPLNDAPPVLYNRVLSGGRRLASRDMGATTTRERQAL